MRQPGDLPQTKSRQPKSTETRTNQRMFEITRDQLRGLNDVQLRELVARLCEAELRIKGLPASAVRWSGAHTAADRGLDVECRLDNCEFGGDYVPRLPTGFQVKKPAMPPSKIENEMSPKGNLRPIFPALAASSGCYVIVSLDDDPTGNPKAQRKAAIRKQISELPNRDNLHTDFYGRAELADWLRQHTGVQLWVRDALGIPLDGWKPHGRWTNAPADDNDELICEPGISIILPGKDATKLDISQGIQEIRHLLLTSNKALRIVGLSGVGKTRIVQALFEDSVGTDPLDRSLAIYNDFGTPPKPSPRELLSRFKAENRPATLILDNCPTETHSLLADEVSATPNIRLITIEYDIREDKPELTAIIRIDAEGAEIAKTLVSRRYTKLSSVNTRKIAEFSGGNSRLALAVADAVDEKENLSSFSNAQLFDRLFHQRDNCDANLLEAAQVLALVYSYSVSADQGGVDELKTLARLADLKRSHLYSATHTLLERQLIQKRGVWRAILPQAVSNRLAARALHRISLEDLRETFEEPLNSRLLKSFGKRLGYLHDHEVAQAIVGFWLSPGGMLHNADALDDDQFQLLSNVAPVAPAAMLDAIETRATGPEFEAFLTATNHRSRTIAALLCAIAYDSAHFERCIALLVRIAAAHGRERQLHSDVAQRLTNLFALYLSGTKAGPDIREQIVRRTLSSPCRDQRMIGLEMLHAALKSGRWVSFATFEFGARPRSFGYKPETQEEQDDWFIRFLAVAGEVAAGEDPEMSDRARDLLASEFAELWRYPGLRLALKSTANSLRDRKSWPEGWRAILSIKYYDHSEAEDRGTPDGLDLLNELDDYLRPATLVDEIRAYVCGIGHQQFSLLEEFDDDDRLGWQEANSRAAQRAYDLGISVVNDPGILDQISHDLFTCETGYLIEFGRGLASAWDESRLLWDRLVEYLERLEGSARHCQILYGVLDVIHRRDAPLAKAILDEAATNGALRPFIVNLYGSVPMSRDTISVFFRTLEFSDTPLNQFSFLASQPLPRALPEPLLCRLFLEILAKTGGAQIVITGLSMRVRLLEDGELGFGSDLKRIGLLACTSMLSDSSHYRRPFDDRHLARVLDQCLDEPRFPNETTDIMDAFVFKARDTYGSLVGLNASAAILATKIPFRFLDSIFLHPDLEPFHRRELFTEGSIGTNPLAGVDGAILIEWCGRGEFEYRLAVLAQAIHPFAGSAAGAGTRFSAQARAIIDHAPEKSDVLRHFANSVRPRGWSGSLADIMAARCRPFEMLLEDDRPDVRTAARELVPQIKDWEARQRQCERTEDDDRDLRFE